MVKTVHVLSFVIKRAEPVSPSRNLTEVGKEVWKGSRVLMWMEGGGRESMP